DEPVTQDLFTLAIDHGPQPQQATYAYVVLPAQDYRETDQYARHPAVTVVSNTPMVQAVSHTDLPIHYAIFYEPVEVIFADGSRLSSDKPASYLIKESERAVDQVSVADPTRRLEDVTFRIQPSKAEPNTRHIELPQGQVAGK